MRDLVAIIAFTLALAQQAGSKCAACAQDDAIQGLAEVVVTAERCAQGVLTVPTSIQAVTGEELQASGVKDMTSLQFNTPGFVPDTKSGFVQIYMRGIGNAGSFGNLLNYGSRRLILGEIEVNL